MRSALLVLIACLGPAHAPASTQPISVVDLHVDLAFAVHVRGVPLDAPDHEANPQRLSQGNVATIVVPLFVPEAAFRAPGDVRSVYEATYKHIMTLPLPSAIVFSFEGADGFADDASAVDAWLDRGACVVGFVHMNANALAGSSQDPSPEARSRGLSESGRKLALRVAQKGGVLDIAHASDAAAIEIIDIAVGAKAPVIDSHTGMRSIVAIDRNLPDALATTLAHAGGVAGIDLHSGHISPRPGERATLDDVVAHVLHARAVMGIAGVAIGSDLDGNIDPPTDSDGAATWPLLQKKLAAAGLTDAEIRAMMSENARRVLGRCKLKP